MDSIPIGMKRRCSVCGTEPNKMIKGMCKSCYSRDRKGALEGKTTVCSVCGTNSIHMRGMCEACDTNDRADRKARADRDHECYVRHRLDDPDSLFQSDDFLLEFMDNTSAGGNRTIKK